MNAQLIKELMEQYNENKANWIIKFGSSIGFDEWFTKQVKGN